MFPLFTSQIAMESHWFARTICMQTNHVDSHLNVQRTDYLSRFSVLDGCFVCSQWCLFSWPAREVNLEDPDRIFAECMFSTHRLGANLELFSEREGKKEREREHQWLISRGFTDNRVTCLERGNLKFISFLKCLSLSSLSSSCTRVCT